MSEKIIFEVKNAGVCYRQRAGLLRYDNHWALKDVSFTLHAGETLGVIGSNGAGKSTLLRMIAGIIDPDRGQVWRQPNTSASLLALNVGFKPELSGRENAILSGLLLGMSLRQIKSQIDAIHQFSGLGNFFERAVGTYSTGMRARLGFAVAIQADPDILLIDEVLGVGDQNFKVKSHAAMREKIDSNKTVVLVSHSMDAIKSLCDRVLWLHEGRSMFCDDADSVTDGYLEVTRIAFEQERQEKATGAGAAL